MVLVQVCGLWGGAKTIIQWWALGGTKTLQPCIQIKFSQVQNQKRAGFIHTTQDSHHTTTGKTEIHVKTSCSQEVQEISSKHKLQDHISHAAMSLEFNSLFSTATVTGGENVMLRCCWAGDGRTGVWLLQLVNIHDGASHHANRGFVTLLNSKQMNLPPGFSTRRASCRAWDRRRRRRSQTGNIAHTGYHRISCCEPIL